jgi:hypothetical protein
LHISLYPEDIRRLDALTDNRSEFIRQCIAKAWAEKHDGEVTLTVKLPRRLLHGLLTTASVEAPPQHAGALQALVDQVVTEEVVVEEMARPGAANHGIHLTGSDEDEEDLEANATSLALIRTGG